MFTLGYSSTYFEKLLCIKWWKVILIFLKPLCLILCFGLKLILYFVCSDYDRKININLILQCYLYFPFHSGTVINPALNEHEKPISTCVCGTGC